MKKTLLTAALLAATLLWAGAQICGTGDCDCASCTAAKEGRFTLPGLQGLDPQEHAGHDHSPAEPPKPAPQEALEAHDHSVVPHDHDGDGKPDHEVLGEGHEDHEGHDHDAEEAELDAHEDHEGHDHAAPEAELDAHAGHDHGAVEGVEISTEMGKKIGLQIHEAEGGTIAKASIFPAEIKLNRDRAAAVSPRYASLVRQVFAEIGDTVKKDDVLASLENRETMAVYTIAAPLDGTIISKNLAVGETASADKVLFEVANLSSVWADINIFPKYQHWIRKGMPVKFMAHDGHTAHGTVKYISPILSHETRTFIARCILEGSGEDFTPGAFVRAQINIETAHAPVVVEREAIQVLEGETVIFAPGDHGFLAVEVELGLADEYNVEIKSGLKPGDPYVAVGAFALKAHMVTSGMDPHAGHGH